MINYRPKRIPSAKFNCRKVRRPQTKHVRDRLSARKIDSTTSATTSNEEVVKPKENVKKGAIKKDTKVKPLIKKPENLCKFEMGSDISTDHGMDVGGNFSAKLASVVNKLQDLDW